MGFINLDHWTNVSSQQPTCISSYVDLSLLQRYIVYISVRLIFSSILLDTVVVIFQNVSLKIDEKAVAASSTQIHFVG